MRHYSEIVDDIELIDHVRDVARTVVCENVRDVARTVVCANVRDGARNILFQYISRAWMCVMVCAILTAV